MKFRSNNGKLLIYKNSMPNRRIFWQLYDRHGKSVLTFFDYIDHLICHDEHENEVENIAYSLRMWFEFLDENGLDQFSATDDTLRNFIPKLQERKSNNRKGDEFARNRSINKNLTHVYNFYAWLQEYHREGCTQHLLGESRCNIRSSLLERNEEKRSLKDCYPLLIKGTGSSSKHKIPQAPSASDLVRIVDYFRAAHDRLVAERNVIAAEVANEVGLRRGSIFSLDIGQFTREKLDDCERSGRAYLVQPKDQKFNYDNFFEVELLFVERIIRYIESERLELVTRTKSASNKLFLNSKSGQPLSPEAMTNLMIHARRALGLPKDFGLHGLRRKFARDKDNANFDASLEIGGDTSAESLAAIGASQLGQSNTKSRLTYLRNLQQRFKHTETFRRIEENFKMKDMLSRLQEENRLLNMSLSEVHQLRSDNAYLRSRLEIAGISA